MAWEIWSKEWVDETLKQFNVPGEVEFDICDNCKCTTHIRVATWMIIEDNKTILVCKACKLKINKNEI